MASREEINNQKEYNRLLKEQESIGGYGLPWKNLDHFLELALSRNIFQYNSQKEKQ